MILKQVKKLTAKGEQRGEILPDPDLNRGNPAGAGNNSLALSSGIVAIIWPMNPGQPEHKK